MDLGLAASAARALPELLLGAGVVGLLLADLVVRDKTRLGEAALLLLAVVLVAATWGASGQGDAWLFGRMVASDAFALFFRLVVALAAIAVVWMSLGSREIEGVSQGEYYALLLAATLGMFLMAAAGNLLMAYLSLELVSLTSYALTGMLRHDRRSGEAALKYLIYGGVASGIMIFGLSWIYGLAGSLDYAAVNTALRALPADQSSLAVYLAVVLSLAGFGYKIAAVPFHMWAPDVYTGASIPVTAFLSVASKAAGFALLVRFFYPGLSVSDGGGSWSLTAGLEWPQLVLVLCMVTMTVGNLAALRQENLKRLLAYSSIAHAGYLLMGFVVLTDQGLTSMLFYLVTYYLMNIGAFLVVMVVVNATGDETVDGVRGLAWRGGAGLAVAMAIFLFSLAGLPPLAGFVGKVYLFAAVIDAGLYALALVGLLNSVLSLYYYARIVRAMFLDFPRGGEPTVEVDWSNGSLMWVLACATVALGLYWGPVIDLAGRSIRFAGG